MSDFRLCDYGSIKRLRSIDGRYSLNNYKTKSLFSGVTMMLSLSSNVSIVAVGTLRWPSLPWPKRDYVITANHSYTES